MDDRLLWLGAVLCALAAAAGLLPLARRLRLAGLSFAMVVSPILLAAGNWDSGKFVQIREQPALIAAALIAAALVIVAGALLVRRWPAALAPLLIGALPLRVPVEFGGAGEPANLLLPLYFVIAAGLAAAWLSPGGERGAGQAEHGWLRWSGTALAAFTVLYALGGALADDVYPAVEHIAFFMAPFAALFFLLAQERWDWTRIRNVVWVLAGEGAVFALVAGFQYFSGELFWNDKVMAGNEAHTYFRVNSLFWDPNILGRYLAVTMVALAALVGFGRDRGEALAASALFVVLAATLVVTFSQSSTIALLAGLLVLVAARFGVLFGVAAALLAALTLVVSVALLDGGVRSDESSGRSGLIEGGLEIAADAPLAGTGSGSFGSEFRERFGGGPGVAVESHTEPVTVLAEQGAIGFVAYAALLAVTVGGLLAATGLRLREPAAGSPLAAGLLAIYAVMVVHSLGYAAFLSDPITWAVLALASATLVPVARAAPRQASARAQPA